MMGQISHTGGNLSYHSLQKWVCGVNNSKRCNLNLNPYNSDNSKRRVCIEAIVQLYKLKSKTKS